MGPCQILGFPQRIFGGGSRRRRTTKDDDKGVLEAIDGGGPVMSELDPGE